MISFPKKNKQLPAPVGHRPGHVRPGIVPGPAAHHRATVVSVIIVLFALPDRSAAPV